MRPSPNPARSSRFATALSGLVLLVWGGFAAEMAGGHMAAQGAICGAAAPHCGWCYAAAALLLSGLAAMALALRPTPRPMRLTRRP